MNVSTFAARALRDDRGTGLLEYGLLAVLIAIAALLAVEYFGGGVREMFERIFDNLP